MTIQQAIDHVDRVRPNQFEQTMKVHWLSKLDGMIFREVFQTHEGNRRHHFDGYDCSDTDTELLVPFPYDEDVYNYFLQSQIDKENGEYKRYNQNVVMYNNAFQTFQDWYNRTHMPIPRDRHFRT